MNTTEWDTIDIIVILMFFGICSVKIHSVTSIFWTSTSIVPGGICSSCSMLSVVLVHGHESESNLLVESNQVSVKFLGSKPTLKPQIWKGIRIDSDKCLVTFSSQINLGENPNETACRFLVFWIQIWFHWIAESVYIQASQWWTVRFCLLRLFGLQLHSTAQLQPKQLPRPARFCLLRLFGLQLHGTAHRLHLDFPPNLLAVCRYER